MDGWIDQVETRPRSQHYSCSSNSSRTTISPDFSKLVGTFHHGTAQKKGPRTQGLTRTKALCWSVGFQNGCWPNGGFSTQSSSGSEFSPGGHFSTHNHLTQRTSELQHFQHKSSNKIWARLSARQGGGPKRRKRVPKRSQQSAGI